VSDETAKLRMHLGRCREHARLLTESLGAIEANLPLDAQGLEQVRGDPGQMAYLDQFAYRFGRLQDTMGRQVLPLILEVFREPLPDNATFMEKLSRLERLGLIPSVEDWDLIRELRNGLTHDYPEAGAELAASINQAVTGARALLNVLDGAIAWLRTHGIGT